MRPPRPASTGCCCTSMSPRRPPRTTDCAPSMASPLRRCSPRTACSADGCWPRTACTSTTPTSTCGGGTASLRAMLDRGIRVGLGTDGPASNDGLDLFADLRLAAQLARLAARDATALTAAEAFWLATGAAADAIGRPDLGQLVAG